MSAQMQTAMVGCLLGTAVGDALGLAGEGLSRRRPARMFPDTSQMHFLGRRGMVSDDTEHTCFAAQALIASAGEPSVFVDDLARRLRVWLLGGPAGIGLATLRAILKLCVGVPPERSGVWSAGNGPAMRSALLGVCYGGDFERLQALVKASSRLTHTDPRAEYGALAVAVAAYFASQNLPAPDLSKAFVERMTEYLKAYKPWEWDGLYLNLLNAATSVRSGQSIETFASLIGAGERVSGYVNQTVPIVIHAWLSFPNDYRSAVSAVINCGGDTDTTAAIVGAIVGAGVGKEGISAEWLSALWEWPRAVSWMERLGIQLAEVLETGTPQTPLGLPFLSVLARNLLFTTVVLAHGFRRGLPPY